MPRGGFPPQWLLISTTKRKGGCAIPPNPEGIGFPRAILMIKDEAPATKTDFPMAPNSLWAAMDAFFAGIMRSLYICFPACVYSYDRNTHTVEVMPLVKQGFYNGEWVYIRREPFKTSIRNIQCGGFTVDFPVFVGDTGWVFASDRSTGLLKQEGAFTNSVLADNREKEIIENSYQQRPDQTVLHSLVDGFFLPDNWGAWTPTRYKDCNDIAVADALYIGSSMDSRDEGAEDDDRLQKGNEYEHKKTSSLVLQRDSGMYLASSTAFTSKEEEEEGIKRLHSKVSVDGGRIELNVGNAGTDATERCHSINLDAEEGVIFRSDDETHGQHFILSISGGNVIIRNLAGNSALSVSMNADSGNTFAVQCDGTMNVMATQSINVKGCQSLNVASMEAEINVAGNAMVSGERVYVAALHSVQVAGGEQISILSGKNIQITAASSIEILAKETNAPIRIRTLSFGGNIEISTMGEVGSLDICTYEKNSSINIKTVGDNSGIFVSAEGNDSNIGINCVGSISLGAGGSYDEDGNKIDGTITLNGDVIKLNGKVETGDLKVLGMTQVGDLYSGDIKFVLRPLGTDKRCWQGESS